MERDPAAVLQAAIRSVVTKLPDKEEQVASGFEAAKSFAGPKRGYFFGTGKNGTGYYLDPLAPLPKDDGKGARQAVDAEELLREAEEQANIEEVQLLDAKSLKRHVGAFEKKYKDNLEMRMKYADQPEKFMESEVDLDEEVQKLLAVAGSPELYPDFVKLGAVEHLMALLSHDNTDIAADVIELFQQLTDADVVEDSEEEAAVLVDSMIEHNGIELLVHRLISLTEAAGDDEGKAVFNTLSIFENMVEVKPEVADMVFEKSKLLKWMLARLKPRQFDSIKQYTAEVLAIFLQNSPKNQQRLADSGGIDALLQAIAPYRNRNPGSIDEEEYLENLFNALCACLMSNQTRTLFLQAEGIELMLLLLKQKRVARGGALKALDFATTRSPAACERCVDKQGLPTVFARFMGKSKVKRRKGDDAEQAEEEERALSTIANLFQGLGTGSRRDRLAAKFVENEWEKCDRLMELYSRYHKQVQAAQASLEEEGDDVLDEADRVLASMDQGLYSLQQCALVLGNLWRVGDLGVRKRLLQLLHQKNLALANVREVLVGFRDSIGDEAGAAEQRDRVNTLLTSLGHQEAPIATTATEAAPPLPTAQEPAANGGTHAEAPSPPALPNEAPEGNGAREPDEDRNADVDMEDSPPPPLPTSTADVQEDAPRREDKQESRPRSDTKAGREEGRRRGEEEDKRERRRREEDGGHESKQRHRDRDREGREKDRKHRDEKESRREKDSKKDKRRRDDEDRRDRKRERR